MKKLLLNQLPVLSLIVIALMFRLPQISGSFNNLESGAALRSTQPVMTQLADFRVLLSPVFSLILFVTQLVSHQEWWLRFWVALIPGLITIFATYKIGEKLHSQLTATLAALLLASSSFHIYFSQELRPFALTAMIAMVAWYLIIEGRLGEDRKRYLLFGLISVVGMLTQHTYPYVFIAQLVYVYYRQREFFRPALIVGGFCAIAFLLQIPILVNALRQLQEIRSDLPEIDEVIVLPAQKFIPFLIGTFVYGVMEFNFTPLQIFPGILIIIIAGALTIINLATMKKKIQPAIDFTAMSFLIPVGLLLMITLFFPVIQPRAVLFLLPIFYIYISAIASPHLSQTVGTTRGGLSVLLLITIALINIRSTVEYNITPKLQRENWRQLVARIEDRFPDHNSCLAFKLPEAPAPVIWYTQDTDYKKLTLGENHVSQVPNLNTQYAAADSCNRVLLFDYQSHITDPENKVEETIGNLGFRDVGRLTQPLIGDVHVYTRSF